MGVVLAALGVLAGTLVGTPLGAVATVPAHARQAAAASTLRISAPATVLLGSRALLRAHVVSVGDCGPYAACRSAATGGTIVWTLRSQRRPEVHLRHRSVVDHDRSRWHTPRLTVPGRWTVSAAYSGNADRSAGDERRELRVARR